MTKEVMVLTKGIKETTYEFKEGEINELFMLDETGLIRYCLCGELESIKLRVLHFTYSKDVHLFIKGIYCGLVGSITTISYKRAGYVELIKEEL